MRIVQEKVITSGIESLRSSESPGGVKEYLERVAKYVPAEVIAAYITLNGIAATSASPKYLYFFIFISCLIVTPVYILSYATTRKEKWFNGVMSVIAFIIWAYASGTGFFVNIEWYDPPTASVVLGLFSLFSGAIIPKSNQELPKPEPV